MLVLECLHQESTFAAVSSVIDMLNVEIYNAFNLLIADESNMVAIIGHGSSRRVEIRHFEPGLHIATGWGVDDWDGHRERLIKEYIEASCKASLYQSALKAALCIHSDDEGQGAVCVHESSHVTVSSCTISITDEPKEVTVQHTDGSPCEATSWERVRMVL
jgi:hypothetical protein